MDEQRAAEVLRNIDARTRRIEQILPDLPTRQEMCEAIDSSIRAAVAPLPTRQEMCEAIDSSIQAAMAPLPTRREMHEAIAAAVAPLPTRQEMHEAIAAAVAPLATRQEMRVAIETAVAPLATQAELQERFESLDGRIGEVRDELRRHMDVVAERIHDEVRLVAESVVALDAKTARKDEAILREVRELARTDARQHVEAMRHIEKVERRVAKLEGQTAKRPAKRRA